MLTIDAATKFELIRKIASLPDSLPDESEEQHQKLLEMVRLLEEANKILTSILELEEQRDFAALSEPALAKVWNNAEDSVYDAL
jgi:hypothetical protein